MWIVGVIFAILGLLIGVLALTPAQWSRHIAHWRRALLRWVKRQGRLAIISATEYERRMRELVDSGTVQTIKVFGYTGETVTQDLMRFEDRYRAGLTILMLHRNWLVEASDEEQYNRTVDSSRRWNKSTAIRGLGNAQWHHSLTREFRYYRHQPIIKGAIVYQSQEAGRIAFLSFYQWNEHPATGGSPFKGANMYMMVLTDEVAAARSIINYAESQFDYEWRHGETPDKVRQAEQEANRNESNGS